MSNDIININKDIKFIDFHCDTLSRLLKNSKENIFKNKGHIDITRLKDSNYLLQCFACYVNLGKPSINQSHYEDVLAMIELLKESRGQNQTNEYEVIEKNKDIVKVKDDNRLGCLLAVEEGGIVENDLKRLDELYRKGIRMITLTWNYENCIGYPNKDFTYQNNGLKEFGIEMVKYMDDLGIIIDVSHLSDGGFWDVVKYSKRPFVASHSNARTIRNHPRNLTDEMILAMKERGCVIGLNYYGPFLQKNGLSTLESICKHMEHIIKIGGDEILCLGSDFDGFNDVLSLKGCEDMHLLPEAMRKYGFSEETIKNVCYKNALNFFDKYGI